MSTTYSGTMKVVLTNTFANALDLGTVTDATGLTITNALTNGTGQNKAQVVWHDQRTITTGANETLDLTALTCAFGTATFTKIKGIIIQLTTTTTGYTLKLKAGASNGFSAIFADPSDEAVISNGGTLAIFAPGDGYTVDGTHKTILLTNPAGGSDVYNIMVIGEGSVA